VTPASDIRRNYVPRSRDGRCASPLDFRGTLCPSLLVEILILIDLITRASYSGGHNESCFDLHSRDRLDFSVGIVLHPKRCSRNTGAADERSRLLFAINIYEGSGGEMPLADRVFRRGVALERIVVVGSARFIEQQRPLNRDLARETQNSSATRDLISRAETSVRAEDASREERGGGLYPIPAQRHDDKSSGREGRREGNHPENTEQTIFCY